MSILNLTSGDGSYIRFMPSSNAWVLGKDEFALKKFVMDHNSIKTGWGKMETGVAPDWAWDAKVGVANIAPSKEHRRGFAITLFIKGKGAVEWSTTGVGPVIGFEQIFTMIHKDKDANEGKVPVLEYTGSEAMKVGKGNTRKPKFNVVGWVDYASIPWNEKPEQVDEPAPAPPPAAAPAAAKGPMSFSALDD